MRTSTLAALTIVLATASASAESEKLAKQLTISSGKGVSFYMGSQQGTAIFSPEAGACGLTLTISQSAQPNGMSGMSGMAGGMEAAAAAKGAKLHMQVMPARPARFSTPDGQQLQFNCGPDAQQMFFEMPTDFKYSDK